MVVVYEGKGLRPKGPSTDYSVRILEDQDELYAKKVSTRLKAKGISSFGHGETSDHTCDQQNAFQRYEYLSFKQLKEKYGNKESHSKLFREHGFQDSESGFQTNLNQRKGQQAYRRGNLLYKEESLKIANNPEKPESSDRMEISERAIKLQDRIEGIGKFLMDYKKSLDPDTSILL